MRITRATACVLAALLADPTGEHYGYDLLRTTGLKSGVLYPILERIHRQGWVEREWERLDAGGRPPRRYYRLTAEGAGEARRALADPAVGEARVRSLRWRPA